MSFNIALSGMQAADSDLRIIGNNLANANTIGFKSSLGEFVDVYAAAALGTGTSKSIGAGVQLAAVTQNFNQGSIDFDDNPLHMSISGKGFFVVEDNGTRAYTRAGAFRADEDGYLVNAAGDNVIGDTVDSGGNLLGTEGNLQINTNDVSPSATTASTIGVNLNSEATDSISEDVDWDVANPNGSPPSTSTYTHSTSTTIYDSLGSAHVMTLYFAKTSTANQWNMRVRIDNTNVPDGDEATRLTFDSAGELTTRTPLTTLGSGVTAGAAYASGTGIPITYTPTNGAAAMTVTIDLEDTVNTMTQFGSDFAVKEYSQNGYTTGRLSSLEVDTTGLVQGRFSNGQTRTMGRVLLASFNNPEGLQSLGDTKWAESADSGTPTVEVPGTSNLGVINAGSVENSNVSTTEWLVRLITAQRNFQANAQTIRTADAVTNAILNIR